MIIFFIVIDLFWSIAALIYDWSKLTTIAPWLWPFVAVCPIFPLLIALVLLQLYRKKSPNQFLLAFAAIPSLVYGLVAVIFYPVAMIYQGFSWNAVGQIFWVGLYAIQGFWLIREFRPGKFAFYSALVFVATKILIVDILFKSFGYFDFTGIPLGVLVFAVLVAFLFFSIMLEVVIKKR